MSGDGRNASVDFAAAVKPAMVKPKRRRAHAPVTVRLTPEERAQLEELAAGMTLSTYIRACLFAEGAARRRKRRPKNAVADKKAMAQALALMGQSRIANNLNQLAHQANIGALDMDEDTRGQIDEAYFFIAEMRGILVKALRSGA